MAEARSRALLPRGLRNTGVYCFFNSVLQSLASIKSFHRYTLAALKTRGHEVFMKNLGVAMEELTLPAMGEGSLDATAILEQQSFPAYFRSGQQQDSEEFFRYLVGAVSESSGGGSSVGGTHSLSRKSSVVPTGNAYKKNATPHDAAALAAAAASARAFMALRAPKAVGFSNQLRSPFEGLEASSLRCEGCGYVSTVRYSDFLNLNLAIPALKPGAPLTLERCIDYYTRTEMVEDFKCSHCQEYQIVQKRTLLGRFPEALCLHLQIATAIYGDDGGGADFSPFKMSAFVRFPETLDLSPYHVNSHPSFFGAAPSSASPSDSEACASSPPSRSASMIHKVVGGAPAYASSGGGPRITRTASPGHNTRAPYSLRAVIVHQGIGVGSGHFITYRRLLRDARGNFCSQERDYTEFVTSAAAAQSRLDDQWIGVSDEHVKLVDKQDVLSSNAYMLFYERM